MKFLGNSLVAAVHVRRDGDETQYSVKPSRKGALKGAVIGASVGRFLGPAGVAGGATLGGAIRMVLGEED